MARPLSEIKPTYRRDAIRRLGVALWLGLLTTGFCHAATLVKVGGYPFPPFVETNTGQHSGLTLELLNSSTNIKPNSNWNTSIPHPSVAIPILTKSGLTCCFSKAKSGAGENTRWMPVMFF